MINLFSSPVKVIEMPEHEKLNNDLASCLQIGFSKNFSDKLPKHEADRLHSIFVKEVEQYLFELKNKNIEITLDRSWSTYTDKYQFQTPHSHALYAVIGVYYIKTNDHSGDLLLHDPRGSHNFLPTFEKDHNGTLLSDRSYWRFKPKSGNLILFPAYLIHSVEPNMSDEKRISLAMNFQWKDFK